MGALELSALRGIRCHGRADVPRREHFLFHRATSEHALYLIVTDPHSVSAHGLVGLVSASDIQTFLTLRMAESRHSSGGVPQWRSTGMGQAGRGAGTPPSFRASDRCDDRA